MSLETTFDSVVSPGLVQASRILLPEYYTNTISLKSVLITCKIASREMSSEQLFLTPAFLFLFLFFYNFNINDLQNISRFNLNVAAYTLKSFVITWLSVSLGA